MTALESMARLPALMSGFDSFTAFVDSAFQAISLFSSQASRQIVKAPFGVFAQTVDIMGDDFHLLFREGLQLLNGCFQDVHLVRRLTHIQFFCKFLRWVVTGAKRPVFGAPLVLDACGVRALVDFHELLDGVIFLQNRKTQ